MFSFFLLIDPHGRRYVYEMIRCCSHFLRRGGIAIQFLFHGTEIRGYSQKIGGYSLECPGGLTTSMLIHILICDIGGVFCTPPPNSARQNSRPYYFLCAPYARALFHSVAVHQVPPKRRFFLFFRFSSGPETTIFLLTRRSATLPMGARGGACVIHAPRRQCVLHFIFIQKIGYISWFIGRNKLYVKSDIQHRL